MSAVTSPQSVSEGGYSISMGERATLLALATSIYKRYGDAGALNTPTPTATWIRQ